jgi:hypothetical protein
MRHPEGEEVTIFLHCENTPDWEADLANTWSAKCDVTNEHTKCYDKTLLDSTKNYACNGTDQSAHSLAFTDCKDGNSGRDCATSSTSSTVSSAIAGLTCAPSARDD